ncbi:MAG: tRNA lysidine(34) synthetase TilS [Pseudomonadota bacterium]
MESFNLPSNARIAVAVSGGADSVALLLLLKEAPWNTQITAITVNHNLRYEAAEEADYVKSICEERQIDHHTLAWEHEDISSNIQGAARDARYQLMTSWCKENNISYLLTAHHADDQIENFFIRLGKASGIFGLSSGKMNVINDIMIIRPLLGPLFGIYKEELKSHLLAQKVEWREDPSNNDAKYLRSQIREWIAKKPEALEKQRILQSIEYLSLAADYIQEDFVELLKKNTTIYKEGYAKYKVDPENHALLKHMVLSHLLTTISGQVIQPRSDAVKRAVSATKTTLHGCILSNNSNILTIYREFGRTKPKSTPLHIDIKWDSRWKCSHSMDGFFVDCLSMEEYIKLKTNPDIEKLLQSVPKNALFTIPVIRDLEKLIAIPHIAYYTDKHLEHITFSFEANYISRLTNFTRTLL